jgi:hypothetical protein
VCAFACVCVRVCARVRVRLRVLPHEHQQELCDTATTLPACGRPLHPHITCTPARTLTDPKPRSRSYTIHIVDTDPTSSSAGGWLEDTSLVDKYKMSDEDYGKREESYRNFKVGWWSVWSMYDSYSSSNIGFPAETSSSNSTTT